MMLFFALLICSSTISSSKITSSSTFYDRKQGYVCFSGKVHVDDEKYQMHTDRAFVMLNGTNELDRIIAIGNVVITNETKRAYGDRASYYRKRGMIVLRGSPAEVMEESPAGNRSVRGSRIRFWIDDEQVEVLESEITAPTDKGIQDVKSVMGK